MFLESEATGPRGEKAPMPASGFSGAETPNFNEAIYQRDKSDEWDDVVKRLRDSRTKVLERGEAYNEEDLFSKKRFTWTGSTSVASCAISATSSHYSWATKLIRNREWIKACVIGELIGFVPRAVTGAALVVPDARRSAVHVLVAIPAAVAMGASVGAITGRTLNRFVQQSASPASGGVR